MRNTTNMENRLLYNFQVEADFINCGTNIKKLTKEKAVIKSSPNVNLLERQTILSDLQIRIENAIQHQTGLAALLKEFEIDLIEFLTENQIDVLVATTASSGKVGAWLNNGKINISSDYRR